jgi:hypothetical protein
VLALAQTGTTLRAPDSAAWRPGECDRHGGLLPVIKATLTYPMSTGRNFAEILRLLDSCQLTATEQVATPANWEQGEDVIILPAVSNEDAKAKYPDGWKQPLPYIRIVPQPK